ncbi:hypothetical protein J6590_026982 [Homalodisca vitripennis]|nr:hypothetical protein J6590_026982 [Homalodisca vitripennis]
MMRAIIVRVPLHISSAGTNQTLTAVKNNNKQTASAGGRVRFALCNRAAARLARVPADKSPADAIISRARRLRRAFGFPTPPPRCATLADHPEKSMRQKTRIWSDANHS